MRRALKLSLGLAGAVGVALVTLGLGVFATPGGRLHLGEYVLSSALHRPVRLGALSAHVFVARPSFHAEGVVVTSPRSVTPVDLLRARTLDATLDWSGLWQGQPVFRTLALDQPQLHLVRLAHGRNNYTFGAGGAGSALRHVESLAVSGGRLIYEDPERHLTLDGGFSHAVGGGPQALKLQGGGVANGQPFTANAQGAQLNGRRPSDPYGFSAHMVDGQTELIFEGTTQKPFDFRGFDLAIHAKGQNLADLHYLFGVDPVNSPPFEASGHASKANHVTRFTGIVGRLGSTDLSGDIIGDDRGPRRKISAQLKADTVHLDDVAALLTRAPDHAATRSQPGRSDPGQGGGGLSSKPFSLKDLRAKDLDLQIQAASVVGAPVSIANLHTRIQLTSGLLVFSPLDLRLAGAPVIAQLRLDARSAIPRASLSASAGRTRLSALRPTLAKTLDGELSGRISLVGAGASPAALAADTSGEARLILAHGRLAGGPAEALGGDLFKALTAGKGGHEVNLQCAGGRATLRQGVLDAAGLRIFTDVGETEVAGTVDLGRQHLDLRLLPRARGGDPAQVTAPITLTGPLAKPKLTDHVVATVKRQGVGAAVKLALSPLTGLLPQQAQSYGSECAAMTAQVR